MLTAALTLTMAAGAVVPPVTGGGIAAAADDTVVVVPFAAYNLNGPATTVDGISFKSGDSPELKAGPINLCGAPDAPMTPPVSPALDALLRCFVWGRSVEKVAEVSVANVPAGTYEVSIWTWEDTLVESFGVAMEGAPVDGLGKVSTVPGEWRILGPFTTDVNDGTLNIESIDEGAANFAAIKIDRITRQAPVVSDRSRFVPVNPVRVLDTRAATAVNYSGGKPAAGSVTRVPVSSIAGVPATGVTAVVLNVTATETDGPGFVTAFASGSQRPTTSNLNIGRVGQTVPNLAIVPVGADGNVSLFTSNGSHLLADFAGYFTSSPGNSGRFHGVDPTRVIDTRPDTAVNYAGAKPGRASTVRVPVVGQAGVPATATAAVVTITATDASAAGFISAFPAGLGRPLVSNLNVPAAGSTIANVAIVPLGDNGALDMFIQEGSHLVVDVQGWIGGDEAAGTNGYYIPQTPVRTADSRPGTRVGLAAGPYLAGNTVLPSLGTRPANVTVGAVVYNLTLVEAVNPGYLTAYPAGSQRPLASNVNATSSGDIVPSLSVTRLNGNGINVYHQAGGHLLVDVMGWFTL